MTRLVDHAGAIADSPHREVSPRGPDHLADDPVTCEPVSRRNSLIEQRTSDSVNLGSKSRFPSQEVGSPGYYLRGENGQPGSDVISRAEVPVVWLEHLSETQARAYMLADNKFTDRSSWDDAALAVHLKELSELVLDFDIEDIGFELPEIDFRIQSLDAVDDADLADEFQLFPGFAVSRPSDLWLLGYHRLYCGSALETTAYDVLLNGAKAATVFTDPPYNVKIDAMPAAQERSSIASSPWRRAK